LGSTKFFRYTNKIYRETLEFLDVDPFFNARLDIINPNKMLKWPRLKKYTMDSPYFRKTLRLLFSSDIYAGMKRFYKDKIVTYRPRDSIDGESRKELMVMYKKEVEKIGDLIKRDLITLWGYDKI